MVTTEVFVYGTLKRGFFNYSVLKAGIDQGKVRFLSKGVTRDPFVLTVGGDYWIPYLQEVQDVNKCLDEKSKGGRAEDKVLGRCVEGEIYRVDSETLARLDELEGVANGHYKHARVQVNFSDYPKEVECVLYVKCKVDLELATRQSPLGSYSLSDHLMYVPPMMRAGKDALWQAARNENYSVFNTGDDSVDATMYQKAPWTRFARLCVDVARALGGVRVLEVGCGAHAPAAAGLRDAMAQANCEKSLDLTLCDSVPSQLERLALRLSHRNNQALNTTHALLLCDLLALGQSLPARRFDLVCCVQVLRYIPPELHFHAVRTLCASLREDLGSALLMDWPSIEHEKFVGMFDVLGMEITIKRFTQEKAGSALALIEWDQFQKNSFALRRLEADDRRGAPPRHHDSSLQKTTSPRGNPKPSPNRGRRKRGRDRDRDRADDQK